MLKHSDLSRTSVPKPSKDTLREKGNTSKSAVCRKFHASVLPAAHAGTE